MTRRAMLAAGALVLTVSTTQAGIADAVPARVAEAAPHMPQMMPGPGPTVRNNLLDDWENFKDWFRPMLGRVMPVDPMY